MCRWLTGRTDVALCGLVPLSRASFFISNRLLWPSCTLPLYPSPRRTPPSGCPLSRPLFVFPPFRRSPQLPEKLQLMPAPAPTGRIAHSSKNDWETAGTVCRESRNGGTAGNMLQASNCTLFSRRHVPMSLVSMAFLGPVRNSASSRCQDARRPSCWVFCWTSTWHRDAQLTGTLAAVHHGGHSGKKQSCNTPGNGFPTWRMMQRGLIHKTIRVGSQIGMPRRELVIVMATLNPSPACPPRMHFISLKSVVEWLAWDIAASACSPCNAPTAAQRNIRLGNFICACVQQPGRLWSRRAGHTIALALHELKGRLHPTMHTL